MSKKKIQPVNEDLNTLDPAVPDDGAGKTVAEAMAENAPIAGGKFDEELKAQLSKIETLEAELVNLTNENDQLKEKLAEYIEKVADLQKKLAQGPSSGGDKRVEELTEENDKYLMRISELTFENAKLTAQIQNMKPNHVFGSPVKPKEYSQGYGNVYRNRPNQNGYVSWN